ncbi:hypothetical protein ERX37_11105, partial [Macrococcus hajekii]
MTDYLVDNTGVTQEEAAANLETMNLDYDTLTSDELVAAMLLAIANEQNASTVVATPVDEQPVVNEESIAIATNETAVAEPITSPVKFRMLTASPTLLSTTSIAAPTATLVGSTTPQNVNNYVKATTTYEILGGGKSANEVWITTDGSLKLNTSYVVDDAVTEGDYFTMDFGTYIHPSTFDKPYKVGNIYDANGSTIAIGSYDATTNTAKYTFTNYVDLYNNVSGSYSLLTHPKRDIVTDNKQSVPVTVTTAGESTTQNVIFDYGNKNVLAINALDYKIGNTAVFTSYINQPHTAIYDTSVKLTGTGYTFSSTSQIEVYQVTNDVQFRDSFSPDYSSLTKVNPPIIINADGTATINLGDIGTTGYIIKSTADKVASFTGTPTFNTTLTYATVNGGTKSTSGNTANLSSTSVSSTGSGSTATYSIGDTVWVDTNRDGIQNETATGLAGVTVNLLDSTGIRLATTTTDSSGKYIFTGVNNGNYQIQVVEPTGYDFTVANIGTNDTVDSDMVLTNGKYITPVTINSANVTTVDAGLVKETYNIGDRVWDDANKDGVQTTGETGIAGTTVILRDTNNNEIARTTTDSTGNYNFANVANGNYVVEFVTPTGYEPTIANNSANDVIDSDGRYASVTINDADNNTIDSGFTKIVTPTTTPVYNLGDYVWLDSNKDGLQTAGETGIGGVQVLLKDANNRTIQTTVTDNAGNYGFYDLPQGTYTVEFIAPGSYTATTTGTNPASTTDSNGIKTTVNLTSNNTSIDLGLVQQPPTVTPEYELTIDDVSYEIIVRENTALPENTISLVQQGADGRERVVYQLNPDVDPSTMTATNNEEFYSKYFTEVSRQVIYAPQDAIIEYNLAKAVQDITYNPTANTYNVTYTDGTTATLPGQSPSTITSTSERGTGSIDGGPIVNGTWINFYTVDANGVRSETPYDTTFIPDGTNGIDGTDGTSPTISVVDNADGTHTVTITNPDGTITTTVIKDGEKGDTGATGATGADGKDGVSPTVNVTDNGDGTHTVTVNNPDGTTSTTIIKDGVDGESPTATVVDNGDGTHTVTITNPDGTTTTTVIKDGVDGVDGKDGVSPTATVVDNGDGTHTVTITNPDGTTTTTVIKDGADGESPTATVVDNGDGTHTVTITNPDGTTTTTVIKDGADGESPTATVVDNGDGTHTVTITNPDGTTTTTVIKDGVDGKSPTATVVDNGDGTHTVTITNPDGTTTTTVIKDGADGESPTAT